VAGALIVMVSPITSVPLALVVASTVQFADMAPCRSEGVKLTEPTEKAWGWSAPLGKASCPPICAVALVLAADAEVVVAKSGSEIAPATSTADNRTMRDLRI